MHTRISIFLVTLAHVLLASSSVWACGDHADAGHARQYHHQHIAKDDQHHECGSIESSDCVDATEATDSEVPNHCHCPGCHAGSSRTTGNLTDDYQFSFSAFCFDVLLLKQAFYFSQHLPEEICLPIWQPPQLGA
jgi:hypothetical protein